MVITHARQIHADRESCRLKEVRGVVEESTVECFSIGTDYNSGRTVNGIKLKVNGKEYYGGGIKSAIRIDVDEEVILHIANVLYEDEDKEEVVAIQVLKKGRVVFRILQENDQWSKYSFE
jgi:hypothetical protein